MELKKSEDKYRGYILEGIDLKSLELLKSIIDDKYQIKKEFKNDDRTFVALIEISDKKYMLKVFLKESSQIWKKFLTFFSKGEARKTFENTQRAIESGLNEVVRIYGTAVKRKYGMVKSSFLIMEYIDGEIVIGQEDKYIEIFNITKKMHSLGIYHGDCNPYNFLFLKNGNIKIIDSKLNRMRFGNYRAHYDLITFKKYLKRMVYPYKKNIFWILAKIIKENRK